jgi:hypothetical protein
MKSLAQNYPPNRDIRLDDRFNELPAVIAPMQRRRRFLIETLPERENISLHVCCWATPAVRCGAAIFPELWENRTLGGGGGEDRS